MRSIRLFTDPSALRFGGKHPLKRVLQAGALALPLLFASGTVEIRRPVDMTAIQPNTHKMIRDVRALSALSRNPAHLEQLNLAADYIRHEWEKLGLTVTEQPFTFQGKPFKNVMVSFGPPNAERVIIGAHYDVLHDKPGADDNASGVAGLLELSRLLVAHPQKLTKRLDLVAYTLEEMYPEALGSRVHAQQLVANNIPVRGMISLEMIGYYRDTPNSQAYPVKPMQWVYPSKGNFIAVVGYGKALPWIQKTQAAFRHYSTLPACKLYLPLKGFSVDRSDHSNYADVGIPALMVTDTANFRNPNYHRATDTIETLDFQRMGEVVKAMFGLVSDL
jgi:Zn-dependent M28 family amino/carboxypeptidase